MLIQVIPKANLCPNNSQERVLCGDKKVLSIGVYGVQPTISGLKKPNVIDTVCYQLNKEYGVSFFTRDNLNKWLCDFRITKV